MIDPRRYESPPVCAVLDALQVSVSESTRRLGLTVQLWYLWRNGTRRPSQKALWGLTLLAQEALLAVESSPIGALSEAARCQRETLMQYVRSLLLLQDKINLSLSPAAKSAAQFQLQQTACIVSETSLSI